MNTETWYECPNCKKETTLDWYSLSLAGKFTEQVKCSCGAIVNINVEVTTAQPCGHPLSAIVHNGTTNYCSQCADDSLRENINKGIEA